MTTILNIKAMLNHTSHVMKRLFRTRPASNRVCVCLSPELSLDLNNINAYQTKQFRRCFSSYRNNKPTLTLFTNDDCTLCDDAMKELAPFLDQVDVERVDITLPKNKEWYDKYRYDIPVFHLNGEFLMKHRVDLEHFKQKLSELKDHTDLS